MIGNPYKYTGPLDLEKDRLVCVPRLEESERVINGVREGKFWAILGPRQMGKSTFLRQLESRMTNHFYCLSFSFETFPPGEKSFYQWRHSFRSPMRCRSPGLSGRFDCSSGAFGEWKIDVIKHSWAAGRTLQWQDKFPGRLYRRPDLKGKVSAATRVHWLYFSDVQSPAGPICSRKHRLPIATSWYDEPARGCSPASRCS